MSHQPGIDVVASICEGTEKSLDARCERKGNPAWLRKHVDERTRAEYAWFDDVVSSCVDRSKPYMIAKGVVNSEGVRAHVAEQKPDMLVCYGASIIKEPLLSTYAGRFLNIHLGMSPWYRGAGTNIFALANGDWHLCGATFMHIDAGIDTGAVIHQDVCRPSMTDTIHDVGLRVIRDMVPRCAEIVRKWHGLGLAPTAWCEDPIVVKGSDFCEQTVKEARYWCDWYRQTGELPREHWWGAEPMRNGGLEP